jgi:hypothetical protein
MEGGKTDRAAQRRNLEKTGCKAVALRHEKSSPAEYGSVVSFQSSDLHSARLKFIRLKPLPFAEFFIRELTALIVKSLSTLGRICVCLPTQ